jgi:hypothetical protein
MFNRLFFETSVNSDWKYPPNKTTYKTYNGSWYTKSYFGKSLSMSLYQSYSSSSSLSSNLGASRIIASFYNPNQYTRTCYGKRSFSTKIKNVRITTRKANTIYGDATNNQQ